MSNPACAQGGMKALAIVETASARAASARETDSPMDVRHAMAEVQTSISAAQAQLFACRAAVSTPLAAGSPAGAMAGVDHSKMAMGTPASIAKPAAPGAKPAAKPADAMVGMDHSKMNMGKPASTVKPPAPGARPAAKPADAMAGMDHSKMSIAGATPKADDAAAPGPGSAGLPTSMAERVADPACPDNVGKATAPKSVYERKVYYFCSSKARDEFRKDPGAYLKKHPR
ncbi:MAG: YHS domain-containing protein [Vicinamibacterales bacterium]